MEAAIHTQTATGLPRRSPQGEDGLPEPACISYALRMGVRISAWKIDKHGRKRYRIWWSYKGANYHIHLTQDGRPLIDKEEAAAIAGEIASEIKRKTHDPLKWLPEKRNKRAVANAISRLTYPSAGYPKSNYAIYADTSKRTCSHSAGNGRLWTCGTFGGWISRRFSMITSATDGSTKPERTAWR